MGRRRDGKPVGGKLFNQGLRTEILPFLLPYLTSNTLLFVKIVFRETQGFNIHDEKNKNKKKVYFSSSLLRCFKLIFNTVNHAARGFLPGWFSGLSLLDSVGQLDRQACDGRRQAGLLPRE